MRILMLSNLYPPHFLGGYELLCRDVTEALRQRGHELAVLTSDHGGPAEPCDYPVWRSLELTQPLDRDPRSTIARRCALTRSNARRMREVLAAWRPDVVFAWNQNRITLGPLYEAQRCDLPVALTLNDEHMRQFTPADAEDGSLRQRARRMFEELEPRLTFRGLDLRHATCISAALQRNMADHGFPAERLQVIHQGIPLEDFPLRSDPGSLADPPVVLYTGGLHEDKGVSYAIEAVARVRAQGSPLRLRVVGSGSPADQARLRELAARVCPGAVEFVGRVPREDMSAIYRAADLFVFPSVWEEPFGLTHLEAMASGLPVVATPVGGCREFLRHRNNALVVPPRDVEATADALAQLLRDEDLRRQLIAGGRATLERDLNLERYVDDLQALLERAQADALAAAA